MILTVLVGNTNTRLVWFQAPRLRLPFPIFTKTGLHCPALRRTHYLQICKRRIVSSDNLIEYLLRLRLTSEVTEAAMACVVPRLTLPVYRTLSRQIPTYLVTSKTRTPLRFRYDRSLLGTDRVCVAVGGYCRFRRPLIVIDFGTAITVNAIDKNGLFLGGPILPGLEMMLSSLANGTGRLPRINFAIRKTVITRTTTSAIRAGVFNLLAGGLKHIITRISVETRSSFLVIATGGFAPRFKHHLEFLKVVDEDLGSKGLAEILYLNRR
ncbi:MAG: type III pantothenate kinase [bacterium]